MARMCSGVVPQQRGRLCGRLVVLSHLVGQPGVGVAAHGAVGPGGDVRDERREVLRPERAVEPEAERAGMADGAEEGFRSLAGQGAPAAVGGRHGDHQRQRRGFRDAADGVEGRLGVQGVETGLQQQDVHAALQQPPDLPGVGLRHLVEGDRPPGGVGKVLRQGERFAGGAERSGHPDAARRGLGGFARESRARPREILRLRGAAVLGLGQAVGAEGVGRDDVRARIDVGAVDVQDRVRMGQVEGFAVAAETVALEHRAHRPVQDQDPATQRFSQSVHQKQVRRMWMMFSLRPIV